ncbi:hypothetical protein DFP83_102233 [Idiomarina fontislapidosi]|uniref:DUF4194 domain-containing protein n=1 Tax=Idiomarina fontislapidosi TaxID=263723 RepID=A0A432Y9C0_9GAMM|nr:hypothetical protein [Idiomarina fontislapidosi]PYE34488.1 hypothetical protein DFP83_102233 [Idiomarina fontislapidosi]RUO57554.1 hypothetical protein CWE25_03565 [Idiomarina fontislapidosi]
MMTHGPLIEALLNGEFICAQRFPEYHQQLQDEALKSQINDYLRPLNRTVSEVADGSVFFLSYQRLDKQGREHLRQQFTQTLATLMPLLEWLTLIQEALGHDSTLVPGDTVKLPEWVMACEDNPSLKQRLAHLAKDRFFNSQAETVDAQIKQIAKRLVEHGYLMQPHHDRPYFIVTGKVDYLIDVIRFIRDEENLPVEENPEQEALL